MSSERLSSFMDKARARLAPVRGTMSDTIFDALVDSVARRQYREELADEEHNRTRYSSGEHLRQGPGQ